ncbi:YlmC/YmxH family sporulation protein [Clostridium sp. CX1]|uniref:YlmC/YmxH family sporulation protein n=1 Tax=Clostridium tanneri TaxID=3037988 RepID=A0ABU4JT18_9CLOT|nr:MULTISPECIES: YlmC/YmxH family sporulation protein [unclassified Clostridium]MCT8976904.1 YlmC/YmxH family sporulation protein [Clostridium sp. CX1]MDW8801111.1 YlmC/YmxH family sporulation protein [Clostridium sp. A1-XYC3]
MDEEKSLYSLGNLRAMEIIDINTGTKLGFIKDLKIDCDEYKIISIILPSQKMSWFGKSEDIEVPWENVKKIGVDVLLIDGGEFMLKE